MNELLRPTKIFKVEAHRRKGVDVSMLTSNVKGNSAKKKAERFLDSFEEVFREIPPTSYVFKETAENLVAIVGFERNSDFMISEKMIGIVRQEMMDCYIEHKINFKDCSLIFYFFASSTEYKEVKITDHITRVVTVSTGEFTGTVDDHFEIVTKKTNGYNPIKN